MTSSIAVAAPLAASLFMLVACGGHTTSPPDSVDPATMPDADRTDGGPASQSSDAGTCVDGEEKYPTSSSNGCFYASSHVCGDYSPPFVCVDGVFQCPPGTVPATSCWCHGLNPPTGTCTCTPSGWACSDTDSGVGP